MSRISHKERERILRAGRNLSAAIQSEGSIAPATGSVHPSGSVTIDEAKVIASLLDLYEAAWAEGNHRKDCGCQFCVALESAGEHDFRLYDSLKARFSTL